MAKPLDDDFAAFLRHGRSLGWSPDTIRNYTRKLENVARFCRSRGCRRSADVTAADLDALMQAEADAGTAKSTRVQLASLTQAAFAWLQDQGKILSNPARSLPVPDDGEADLPEPPLSEAEIHAIIAGLPRESILDLRNVCLLELLYGCGLRSGEASRLDLDDVDLAQRTVLIQESKWSQTRILPLMGTALVAVRDYLALRRDLVRGPDLRAFFLTGTGKRMDSATVGFIFRKLNEARGPEVKHLHPHLFRHSIAVHLVRGGADIRHVQAFLGHSSLNTTKIYLRMVPGRLKEDYEKAMPEIAVGTSP
jgi:site-specific recombinase XerD